MKSDSLEDFIIKRASSAYAIAKLRAQKTRKCGHFPERLKGKSLAEAFPRHYTELPNSKHVVFDVTRTADAIIEEYLSGLGYSPASPEWCRLSRIVMDLGEEIYRGDKKKGAGGPAP